MDRFAIHKSYRSRTWIVVWVLMLTLFMLAPMRAAYGKDMSLSQLRSAYQVAKQNSIVLSREVLKLSNNQTRLSSNLHAAEQAVLREERMQILQGAVVLRAHKRVLRDQRLSRRYAALARRADSRMKAQLRFWYEQGSIPLIEIIFAAHSLSDLLYRVSAMDLLLQRQRTIFLLDARILREFHALTRRAQTASRQAHDAYANIVRIREQIAADAAHKQGLMAQLTAVKIDAARQRVGQIQNMQRLASEISAVILAQKRAAAAAAAAAAAKKGTTPPAVSGVLDLSAVRADLTDAAHTAGVSSSWVPWLLLLVQYESGGNPTAVSPEAVAGQHASGLLQMLPDTFSRYARSGYTDIWNPVDNAIAAIEYIKAAYGAPWNIPGIGSQGTYRGY